MRVAIFSDVQGNPYAMEVVVEDILDWKPDLVVMNGDLINRGPNSLDCLLHFQQLRSEAGWLPLRGNHEDFVLRCAREPAQDPLDAEMRRFADWTSDQVGDLVDLTAAWADHLCFHAPGGEDWVHVTHGTLLGNRDGISASLPDEGLVGRLPEGLAVFVTAHTHRPLVRRFGGTQILNVGSVGAPFDGDVRAAYGQLQFNQGAWQTGIVRLAYDRERTDHSFHQSGFLEQGGPLAHLIYWEWRHATPIMPQWHRQYGQAVLGRQISLDRSVREFLARL